MINPEWEMGRADEHLRIVPKDLWDRVKSRQRACSEEAGEGVRRVLKAAAAKRSGRKPGSRSICSVGARVSSSPIGRTTLAARG